MKCSRAAAFSAWVGVVNDIVGEVVVLLMLGDIEVLSGRSMLAKRM